MAAVAESGGGVWWTSDGAAGAGKRRHLGNMTGTCQPDERRRRERRAS